MKWVFLKSGFLQILVCVTVAPNQAFRMIQSGCQWVVETAGMAGADRLDCYRRDMVITLPWLRSLDLMM